MPTKQAAQVPLARKAAALKAKAKQPQPTPQQVRAQNRKAQVAADAFAEELEQHEQDNKQVPRLLSKAQVLQRVPFTYPTLWSWMRKGLFPRARQVGGKTCWLESEINGWITAQPLRRFKGDAEAEATAAP
jgi:predicted DNA-binding transcriptional regulator AlpA